MLMHFSTLANILYRYAHSRGWAPLVMDNVLDWNSDQINETMASGPWHKDYLKNKKYDFFGQHFPWDAKAYG